MRHEYDVVVAPLDDVRCAGSDFAGNRIRMLRSARSWFEVPHTTVVSALTQAWTFGAVAQQLGELATRSNWLADSPLSVRLHLVSAEGRVLQNLPEFNNISLGAFAELSADMVTAAGPYSLSGPTSLVASVQAFRHRDLTMRAWADKDRDTVVFAGCWFLDEDLGSGLYFDRMTVNARTGSTDALELSTKPTATVATGGGTWTVEVAPELRHFWLFSLVNTTKLATAAREASVHTGSDLALVFAVRSDRTLLLDCQSLLPGST